MPDSRLPGQSLVSVCNSSEKDLRSADLKIEDLLPSFATRLVRCAL